jgi:transposase-like protein
MDNAPRQHLSAEEKVAILRRHLLEKVPVSELCDKHGISPNNFYNWQKIFFENGAAAFGSSQRGHKSEASKEQKRVAFLEGKLQRREEALAELMEDHVRLKKNLGES